MEAKQNTPSTRPGTPGLDVFKIAGQSISGFLRSFKTGDHLRPRQAFTSLLEERLAAYLEYHPHVRFYQRGDASEACANAYRLVTDLGTPYRINYVFDGKSHEYLPDFVGTLCDGGLLIAEAGRETEKRKGQPLAKAEAARTAAKHKGGIYIIGTEENLSERRHQNLLRLHAYRQGFPTYDEIAAFILKQWPWGELRSAGEFMQRFGSRWSEPEVEATVWKLVGDAAAAGRLLVDLTEVELSHSTLLALLDPNSPPILPDPLPFSLEVPDQDVHTDETEDEQCEDAPVELSSGLIPGPTFDASALVQYAEQIAQTWPDGAVIDLNRQMISLTMSLIGKVLFDVDMLSETDELGAVMAVGFEHTIRKLSSPFMLPEDWPTAYNRRVRQARSSLEDYIRRMIEERRQHPAERLDLLSVLLQAQDEDGHHMSDQQVVDEYITLFGAGHETTAAALTWTWYLLCQHPEYYEKVQQETRQVLQGRSATADDLAQLPFCLQVFKEAYAPLSVRLRHSARGVA
jgi:Cytochrome P450